jgi:hypothetical protein
VSHSSTPTPKATNVYRRARAPKSADWVLDQAIHEGDRLGEDVELLVNRREDDPGLHDPLAATG